MTRPYGPTSTDAPHLSTRSAWVHIGIALLAYSVAWYLGFWYWALPVGVLFAAAWLLPYRWWPAWVVAATLQATMLDMLYQRFTEQPPWPSLLHYILGMLAPPLLAMLGAILLHRGSGDSGRRAGMNGIVRLHLAALLVATLFAAKDLVYVLADGKVIDIDQRTGQILSTTHLATLNDAAALIPFALSHFIGAYIGVMLLVPLAMWWRTRSAQTRNRDILTFTAKYLLPVALAYLLLSDYFARAQAGEILRLLLLVAIMVAAMKEGWRGASLATLTVSLVIGVQDHLGTNPVHPLLLQSFIAITGSMGLLLGAARDELIRRDVEMSRLTHRLRETARRNQTQADNLRRWITSEMHDEVGQNLTALQMQLKLAENSSGLPALFAPMRQIIGHMRASVSTLLVGLRPAGLDEFGLCRTLNEGSIRQLMQAAGVDYHVRLRGDVHALERLPEAAQISLYRIVQEAATNTLRHAHASRFDVHLRIRAHEGTVQVVLRCADNGIGMVPGRRRPGGIGLDGIEDRVLSLGGRLRIHGDAHGTRLLVVLDLP